MVKANANLERPSIAGFGIRAGTDRICFPEVKGYKYTPKHNDLIIGVDRATLDLYLVPTRYIDRWGNSVSKQKLQVL